MTAPHDSEKTQDGASDFGHRNLDFKRLYENKQDGDFSVENNKLIRTKRLTGYC